MRQKLCGCECGMTQSCWFHRLLVLVRLLVADVAVIMRRHVIYVRVYVIQFENQLVCIVVRVLVLNCRYSAAIFLIVDLQDTIVQFLIYS